MEAINLKKYKGFLFIASLFLVVVFLAGCSSNNPIAEELSTQRAVLSIDEINNGTIFVNDQEVESGWSDLFKVGSSVNLRAEPDANYYLDGWENIDYDDEDITNINLVVTDENTTIRPIFEQTEGTGGTGDTIDGEPNDGTDGEGDLVDEGPGDGEDENNNDENGDTDDGDNGDSEEPGDGSENGNEDYEPLEMGSINFNDNQINITTSGSGNRAEYGNEYQKIIIDGSGDKIKITMEFSEGIITGAMDSNEDLLNGEYDLLILLDDYEGNNDENGYKFSAVFEDGEATEIEISNWEFTVDTNSVSTSLPDDLYLKFR